MTAKSYSNPLPGNRQELPDMLPGFDAIPEEPKAQPKPSQKTRYYLRIQSLKGEWYFLWKTHSNGGCEWVAEDTAGRKRPLFYKTVNGAQRQLTSYTSSMVLEAKHVAVWKAGVK